MPSPKIPAGLKEELAERNLALWACMHPMHYPEPGTRGRHDTSRVEVQLAGPGLDGYSPWGFGATVREAVDAALANPVLRRRAGGVIGALAELEEEVRHLTFAVQVEVLDGDVPF